jgi:LuxR family maltose regulon positive regulatory protein
MPLSRALMLAEREGYVRIFVDEGPPMAALLIQVARRGAPVAEYAVRLLAALDEGPGVGEQGAKSKPLIPEPRSLIPLAEPLSQRELDVLRLLGTDLSGPDIARELMVSLNTLRTHTKNIYDKLGVNSRRAAVHRAEELDLF